MSFIYTFIVWLISYMIGGFGFVQIIGSIKTKQKHYMLTAILWVLILLAEFVLMKLIAGDYIKIFYIGTIISFLVALGQKKFE